MNLQSPTPAKSSNIPWFIAVGAVTFALGAGGALTLSHMTQSRQNDAITWPTYKSPVRKHPT